MRIGNTRTPSQVSEMIEHTRDVAQRQLTEWYGRAAKDPGRAFEHPPLSYAARAEICGRIVALYKEATEQGFATPEQVTEFVVRQVLEGIEEARYVSRSAAPCVNLMRDERLAVWISIANWMEGGSSYI